MESGAYERAVAATGADVELSSQACPVFVEHVEAGDTSSDGLLEAARVYLEPLVREGIDTLILGCTHYPMLSGMIQMVMGGEVVLVSSAEETAKDVYAALRNASLLRETSDEPEHGFLTTGDPQQFALVAHHFLGPGVGGVVPVSVRAVEGIAWN